MKTFALSFSLLFCFAAEAQITITDADMPLADDTIRVSNAFDMNVDYMTTGPNSTWDFSAFESTGQELDTLFAVAETNSAYTIFFNNQFVFPDHKANYGIRGMEFDLGGFLTLSDVFEFHKYDATSYNNVGWGAFINGIPTPVRYDDIDTVFHFPLNYGDVDSANFSFDLNIPTLGYYGGSGQRKNEVDGWGDLILPMGTYPTLRVRSELDQTDTLYVDMVGFGFSVPRPTTVEYKWLGQGTGRPLLTITTQDLFGAETVQSIVYQDTIRGITGLEEQMLAATSLFPNPSTNTLNITADAGLAQANIQLVDAAGRVFTPQILFQSDSKVSLDVSTLAEGFYVVMNATDGTTVGKIIRRK